MSERRRRPGSMPAGGWGAGPSLPRASAGHGTPGGIGTRTPPAFFFDLGCPFSYLAAERVERLLGSAAWIPSASVDLRRSSELAICDSTRARACARAAELRLPLVWPERFPSGAPMALRAAAHAAETGAGSAFALAAMRLAYCGGFDLEDPEILAEAAAAAGMRLEETLAAAGDPDRDGPLLATARGLIQRGVRELPAMRIGDRYIAGERRLAEAAASLRESTRAHRLAPVC